MKRWAVGYINWFDHELHLEIVEANSWHEAISKHSHVSGQGYELDYTSRETAKSSAFDADCMVEAIQIP